MVRSNRRQLALLALFALASMESTYVRADDWEGVDVATEEVVTEPVVEDVVEDAAEVVADIVEEVVEEVVTEPEPEPEPEPVPEPVHEPEPEIVVTAVESESIVSKIKGVVKVDNIDAKKVAAFGLGAWGTATGLGWAMQKIGKDLN